VATIPGEPESFSQIGIRKFVTLTGMGRMTHFQAVLDAFQQENKVQGNETEMRPV